MFTYLLIVVIVTDIKISQHILYVNTFLKKIMIFFQEIKRSGELFRVLSGDTGF